MIEDRELTQDELTAILNADEHIPIGEINKEAVLSLFREALDVLLESCRDSELIVEVQELIIEIEAIDISEF